MYIGASSAFSLSFLTQISKFVLQGYDNTRARQHNRWFREQDGEVNVGNAPTHLPTGAWTGRVCRAFKTTSNLKTRTQNSWQGRKVRAVDMCHKGYNTRRCSLLLGQTCVNKVCLKKKKKKKKKYIYILYIIERDWDN
jgi:hypothetical protein